MDFNLHLGSMSDTMMMMVWNSVLNTGSGLIKRVKAELGLYPLKWDW